MHCCIIGGNGFIGRHLVGALSRCRKSLTVIDKAPIPYGELPPGVHYISGDYSESSFLYNALKGVDEIVDLAYASVPKTSFEDPVNDILSNLPPAVNLFEVASSLPIKKFVFVSSGGTVYGKALNLPISEEHQTLPVSPYGITKLAVEKYALMYHALKGLPVVCVRPSNAFGEGQQPFSGQGFVATVMASAFEDREINLFGERGVVRDLIYVTDVVSGIIAALDQCPAGECYNIGTGIGTSSQEVLNMIASIAGRSHIALRIKALAGRPYDVPVNILDSSKLKKATGWAPVVPLMEGLELTWKYFEKQYDR